MPNVRQVVPFFMVVDMQRSLAFYVDGLGFEIKSAWKPQGAIRWCCLQLGGASLMLQAPRKDDETKPGQGVSLWFQCEDAIALYREYLSKGLNPSEPQVGNGMWDTRVVDPDGYQLHFESVTDVPEETLLSEYERG